MIYIHVQGAKTHGSSLHNITNYNSPYTTIIRNIINNHTERQTTSVYFQNIKYKNTTARYRISFIIL